jgi:hypothetical protein
MKARSQPSSRSEPGTTEQASWADVAAYCPNLDEWPRRWRYQERDILSGQQIVECFKPFLRHLLSSDLSRKTLRKHRDNLWMLGGEIISDLYRDPELRGRPIEDLMFASLDEEGGPLLSHHQSEEEQRSFDSTCRKFLRFLKDAQKSQGQPAKRHRRCSP